MWSIPGPWKRREFSPFPRGLELKLFFLLFFLTSYTKINDLHAWLHNLVLVDVLHCSLSSFAWRHIPLIARVFTASLHCTVLKLDCFTVCMCVVCLQVFYYTDVKFKSRKNKAGLGHHILSSQLPPMISSIESKLGEVWYSKVNRTCWHLLSVVKARSHYLHDYFSLYFSFVTTPSYNAIMVL